MAISSLTSGWPLVRFGDVVRNVKVDVKPEESGLERYIAGEHMDTEDLHIRRWGLIGDGYLGPAFHRKFVKGQVLYGSRRTYLRKVAVTDFDGICANTTFVLEPSDDRLLPELLPFIMQTEAFAEHSVKQSKGSVNPYINWKDIAWYEFALPPKDEQRRIAKILWVADEAIEKHQNAAELMSQAIRVFFEDSIRAYEKSVTPISVMARLCDAIEEIVAGRSPACSSEPAQSGRFGVLKVSAVGEQGYVEDENKALLEPADFKPEFEVKPGFLLVTRANALKSGVGRACLVQQTRSGLMLSDKTLRLVVDESKARPRFLLEALRSNIYRRYVEVAATGTDAKNISQEKLRNAPIPLPPLEVQHRIEASSVKFYEGRDQVIAHASSLRVLSHRLCNDAFTAIGI